MHPINYDRPDDNNKNESTEHTKENQSVYHWVEKLKRMPGVRQDRVREIKEQIENGTYYTEEKWNAACEKLRKEISS